MPRKRAHPNKTYNKILNQDPMPSLDAKQRARLKTIAGLPRAALPEIQKIAESFFHYSKFKPTRGEIRAMLKLLLKRVTALRASWVEADMETKMLIVFVWYNYLHVVQKLSKKRIMDVMNFRGIFDMWIKSIELSLDATRAYQPGSVPELASVVRNAFQNFDVLFSLSKDSPAVSTVSVIANMVRPTSLDSVRTAVWSEMRRKVRLRTNPEDTKMWLETGTKERPRLKPERTKERPRPKPYLH